MPSVRNITPAKRVPVGKYGHKGLSVIIPAAAPGKRMKSYGSRSLVQLPNEEYLVNHQIQTVKTVYPEAEIILVLGFESEKVITNLKHKVHVVENENYEEKSVVSSIRLGLINSLYDNVLLIYGDLFFQEPSIDLITKDMSRISIENRGILSNDNVGITSHNALIEHLAFGLKDKWAQIAFLTGLELSLFKKYVGNKDNHKKYTHELFNLIIDKGGKFGEHYAEVIEIDNGEDIQKLFK
jgi:choline kinase